MLSQLTLQEQEAIIKLYIAFFARSPEWEGANYWAGEIQKLDSAMSVDEKMDSIADRMLSDSYSFNATIFSADMPLEDFIKQMYLNALGRGEAAFTALGRKTAPDRVALDYWIEEISSGRVTRAGFGLKIFRDSEIFAERGTAPAEEIAKYKFQSAFNANRLEIAKEFVKQENSGELQSDQAILSGRGILKGVPMVRLEDAALSQYVTQKIAAPEDPALYERVAPLNASALVAEITAEEVAAVGGDMPMAASPFESLSLAGGGGAAAQQQAAQQPVANQPVANQPVAQQPLLKFALDEEADGGPGADDTLKITGNLADNSESMIDLSKGGDQDQVGAKVNNGDFGADNFLQKNFENVDLSEVTGDEGATIIARTAAAGDRGSTIIGSKNADTIIGGAGIDTLNGGAGDDDITGSVSDIMDGGAGRDTLRLTGNIDDNMIIELGISDADQISVAGIAGNAQQNFENVDLSRVTSNDTTTITAHANGSTITGGGGADTINGGAGDDTITGSVTDIMNGGAGNDMLRLSGVLTDDNAMIDLRRSGDQDQVGTRNPDEQNVRDAFTAAGTAQKNFENVDLSRVTEHGATIIARNEGSSIIGSDFDDTIHGGSGVDTINGGNGNDTIDVSDAKDIIDAGAGNDTLILTGDIAASIMIDLNNDDDQVGTKAANGAFVPGANAQKGFEIVNLSRVTGDNGVTINADSGGSNITGSENDDTITGGAGVDTLNGGAGGDDITGNVDDIMDGGAGFDILYLTGALAVDTEIDLRKTGDQDQVSGDADQRDFESVDLSGVTAGFSVAVTAHTDGSHITGSKFADTITGSAGDDDINSGEGVDIINGGAGNDFIDGGKGSDTINGGDSFDVITGGDGNDTIDGGEGNDLIDGGKGNDILTGGAGIDAFFFNAEYGGYNMDGSLSTEGIDTIKDFTKNLDRLRFIDGTATATSGAIDTSGITVDISGSGKITRFADAANNIIADYDAKIAAIEADARFDEIKKIAFFEHGRDTYVYHTGVNSAHADDIIIKLENFESNNGIDIIDVSILGIFDYEDVSFL